MRLNLDVEGGPEKLVSAEEARWGVQLQQGLLLEGVPSAPLLVLFGGGQVLFGLHLIQHRAERFALEAAHVQRGNGLTALETQQRDFWGDTRWWRHGGLLGATDETLVVSFC